MNLKRNTILIAFFFANIPLWAQNNLSGIINDGDTKESLPGVYVYIPNLKTGAATDIDGKYHIKNLKSGTYLVEVSFIGYKSIVKNIRISNDTVINFVLKPRATELNEVVVTGVSRSTSLKRSPVQVKTMNRKAFNENSSTNLIDGLKNIPSVSQITTGAAISKPVIRGLGYNRVITLDNGIKQEGQQWGDEHGIGIDEFGVDRVEIVKGPGSLMYGSDGIAGVLNFLPPKAPNDGEVKSQLITNYQSNNNLIGYSLSNAGYIKGFQWLGRFSNKMAGDYQNASDGKVYNSGFKQISGSLMLGINKNWGHSHLTISSFNNNLDIIEGDRDSLGQFVFTNSNGQEETAQNSDFNGYAIGFPHQVVNKLNVASNNYFLLKKGSIKADFGFQNNLRKEFSDPTNPDDIELYFKLNTFNYNIKYNFEQKNGWETSFGIGGMQETNENKGQEFLIPAYHLFDAGVFVFTQKTIDNFTIAGGLRYDNRWMNSESLYLDSNGTPIAKEANANLKFNPFTKTYEGVSGSIGLSYQLNEITTLKANVSRGYRAPNIAELASHGKHEGTFRYELGNSNLIPEISHQIDFAYLLNSDHVTFEVTPFVNFIGHYIYLQKLVGANGGDSILDPTDPAATFKYHSGNATLMGGEIYLDIHPHPLDWLHFENSFSYVQATQQNQADSTKYLPFIPAPKYRGELKAQLKDAGKAFSNPYVKFSVSHFFAQDKFFSAFGTETRTPAYTLLNAGFGANIKGFKRKDFLSLFVSINNIADIAYQSHLSRLKYAAENLKTGRMGVFNMGRNVSVKLIANF